MEQLLIQSNNKKLGNIYMEQNISKKVKEKVTNRLKTRKNFLSLIPNNPNTENNRNVM